MGTAAGNLSCFPVEGDFAVVDGEAEGLPEGWEKGALDGLDVVDGLDGDPVKWLELPRQEVLQGHEVERKVRTFRADAEGQLRAVPRR
jgi:hypothetical protein